MKFTQSFSQKQLMTMRQIMSPVMIQRMSHFGMSYDDLVHHVQTSSQDNVFLKISKADSLKSYSSHRSLSARQDYAGEEEFSTAVDRQASVETLSDHLLKQLDFEQLPYIEKQIVERFIDHLDSRGYLSNYSELKDQIMSDFSVSSRKVGELLKVLQTFEPEGVGARTVKECLRIQIREYNFQSEEIREALDELVQDHLDDIANQSYENITESLGYDEDEINGLIQFIRDNLNPNPASEFKHDGHTNHVVPSFKVSLENGEVVMQNLEEEKGINVSISDDYLKQLDDPNLDADSKSFLEAQLASARQLIETIQYRHENLSRLMTKIVERQDAYFKLGEIYLEPLLQKELAESLEMAPSTISRMCSSKYVETPYGVILLRNLCPREYFGKTAIRIEKIVKDICQRYPELSDQQLVAVLRDEHQIKMARRTVTKYRHQVGEESSRDRSKPT